MLQYCMTPAAAADKNTDEYMTFNEEHMLHVMC